MKHLELIAFIAFMLSITGLYYSGKHVYDAWEIHTRAYKTLGWDEAIKARPKNFTLKCLLDAKCNKDGQYRKAIQGDIKKPYVIMGVASLITALILFFVYSRDTKKPTKDGGEAEFATDLSPFLIESEEEGRLEGYIGFDPGSAKRLQLPYEYRSKHTAAIGRSGAGKTGKYILPNIYTDIMAGRFISIVTDIKYPQTKAGLAGTPFLANKKGLPTYIFAPYEEHSHHLPVLDMVFDWTSADQFAQYFFREDDPGENKFYTRNKLSLLTTLILMQALRQGSMGKILSILGDGKASLTNYTNSVTFPFPELKNTIAAFLRLKNDDQESIINDINSKLSDFMNPNLEKHLKPSENPRLNFDPRKAFNEPCFIYIAFGAEVKGTKSGEAIMRLLKSYFEVMLNRTQSNNKSGTLKVPVRIYLDEFLNMPIYPNMRQEMGTIRSANASYHYGFHGDANGEATYGKDWEAIKDNIGNFVWWPQYAPWSMRDVLSKGIGRGTFLDVTNSKGQNTSGTSRSKSEREVTRALISQEGMRLWRKYQAVVDTEQSQPLKVLTPHVAQKRIYGFKWRPFGIKNPFYPLFKITVDLDVKTWVKHLIELEQVRYLKQRPVERTPLLEVTLPDPTPELSSPLPTDRIITPDQLSTPETITNNAHIPDTNSENPEIEQSTSDNNPQTLTDFIETWLMLNLPVTENTNKGIRFGLADLDDTQPKLTNHSPLIEQGLLELQNDALILPRTSRDYLTKEVKAELNLAIAKTIVASEERLGKPQTLDLAEPPLETKTPDATIAKRAQKKPTNTTKSVKASSKITGVENKTATEAKTLNNPSTQKPLKKRLTLTSTQKETIARWAEENASDILRHPLQRPGLTWRLCKAEYIKEGHLHIKLSHLNPLLRIDLNPVEKFTREEFTYFNVKF